MKQKTRKWLTWLLAIIAVVCLALGLVACAPSNKDGGDGDGDGDGGNGDGGTTTTITLVAPEISLNQETGIISWEKVENASRYYVYEGDETDGTPTTSTSYKIEKTTPGDYTYTVAAYNKDAKPQYSPRSNEVTYTVSSSTGGEGEGEGEGEEDGPGTLTDKLTAPLASIQGNAINWAEVSGAVAYEIYKGEELFDTVEGFDDWGETVLPTTYTLLDAANGDKFTVVAVSGDEDVANSDPSEEVEYVASPAALSTSNEVYITNSTKSINVSGLSGTDALKKVVITLNNNVLNLGNVVDGITVRGTASEDDTTPGYIAEAEYDFDLGAYTATLLIGGGEEAKLYFAIDISYSEVPLGFTVSLADPYNVEDNTGVIATYTLSATEFLDVEIPYLGYKIAIKFDNSVPASDNVLYLTLEDNSTNTRIVHWINGTEANLNKNDGYYTSNTFSRSATLQLSAGSVGVKATISVAVPDVVYAKAPTLAANDPNYDANHIGHGSADPTVFKLNVTDGDYILVVNARTSGFKFYAGLGDVGNASAMTEMENLYSLNITVSGEKLLYIYEYSSSTNNKEGVDINYVALYAEGSLSYDLEEGSDGEVWDALLGDSKENATVFNLVDFEDGDYTLNINANAYGLKFVVIGFGGGEDEEGNPTDLEIKDGKNNYPNGYDYSHEITLNGQQSISIYVTNGTYLVNAVTLTKIVEESEDDLPKLTHGGTGVKFKLEALYGSDASVSFALDDVPNGTYTVVLKGFSGYDDWNNISVIVGDKTVQLCGSNSGYLGDQTIQISGETKLTVQVINGNLSANLTIYLLAPGEEIDESAGGGGGGTGGTATSKTITYSIPGYGWQAIDVSDLQYGEYTLTLVSSDNFLGNYYVATTADGSDEKGISVGGSVTITISSDSIYINGGWGDEVKLTLTKVG